jgi:hypothetical protein
LLAAALAAGSKLCAAATVAGMRQRTAERRAADPQFAALVAEIQARDLKTALARVQGLLVKAAEKLEGLLGSTNEPVALGAVKATTAMAIALKQLVEVDELAARVAELEAARRSKGVPTDERRRGRRDGGRHSGRALGGAVGHHCRR